MSSAATFDAFHDRLTAEWAQTPIVFENEEYEMSGEPAPFVYVEIYGDTYNQESFGAPQANQFLETGVTYLHVLMPKGMGTRDGRVMADGLCNLFREQPQNGVFVQDMSIGSGEPARAFPNYYSMAVTLHWHRRDITSITI
jgi:hypothetical protein